MAEFDLVGTPQTRALGTRRGRVLIVLPAGSEGLNLGRFGAADELPGPLGLDIRDQDSGLGEVHRCRVGMVAEDLDPEAVGLEDGGDEVGLEPLAAEDHLPALDAHYFYNGEGST